MTFRKPELIPTLFFIAAFLTFMTLGSWQMERLIWKKSVMAAADAAQHEAILANLPEDISGLTYRKAALTGIFMHDKAIHLIGRQQGMSVGYYIITPFSLEDDGRIILVNRGFSPLGEESKPEGMVTVTGLLRPAREKRFFAPENVPEKNIWSYEDLDKIGEMIGSKPLPLVLEAIGMHSEGEFPIPNEGKVVFRNDHLGYAITWYLMAIVSAVMFGAYYRKKIIDS